MIILGLFFSCLIALFLCKKNKLNLNDFIFVSSSLSLGTLIGGKLLYLLLNLRKLYYINFYDLRNFNLFVSSGFVFYGSIIGGMLVISILKKTMKIDIKKYLDVIIVIIPLLHSFGRIGCHLVGCCYGKICHHKNFPITIYQNSMFAPNNIPLFPVQLI